MDPQPFPQGARVVAYLRDSGGREQDLSTAQQRESVGKWCAERGLILSRVYEDAARSGTRISGRNAFLEMVSYLENKVPEKGVIFWELSRFSRDYNDCQYYLSDLRRQGYTVHSMTDNIPPGLDGQMLESMKIWMNAKNIEDLKKNITRGLHYVVRTYKAHPAQAPMGYRLSPKTIGKHTDGSPHVISRLVIKTDDALLVKRCFEMRATGATIKEIDNELHLFAHFENYRRMFNNPVYTGTYYYGDEVIPDYCEPIISIELWRSVGAVQEARSTRKGINHPRVVRSRFWLTGLLHCGLCGKSMCGQTVNNRRKYDYYRCAGIVENGNCKAPLIPKAEIENLIIEKFRLMLLQPNTLQDFYEVMSKPQTTPKVDKEVIKDRINTEIRDVKGQITNILKAIKDTGHSQSMLAELKSLEERQLELEGQVARLEMKPVRTTLPKLEDLITQIGPNLNGLSDQEKGIIMRGFIDTIHVQKKDRILIGEIGWFFRVDDNEENIVISLPL